MIGHTPPPTGKERQPTSAGRRAKRKSDPHIAADDPANPNPTGPPPSTDGKGISLTPPKGGGISPPELPHSSGWYGLSPSEQRAQEAQLLGGLAKTAREREAKEKREKAEFSKMLTDAVADSMNVYRQEVLQHQQQAQQDYQEKLQ